MPGRTVVQWDKDDLDALGILKVDCLALGMLSAIRRSLDLLKEHTGQSLDPGHHSRRRPRCLRDDSAGRHGRRVSDRIARTDEHAAAAEAEGVLRPGRRGGDRPPRSDPGEDGPSLLAATQRPGAGGIPQRSRARRPEKDPRRAAVSGAGHEARGRGGGFHSRRSRPAAARDGRLEADRRSSTSSRRN